MRKVIGIDGCKGGWCAVHYDGTDWQLHHYRTFSQLMKNIPDADAYLIDIPIGLGDRNCPRTVDGVVRKMLSPHRHSSVFTPPVREVLMAKDYAHANELSQLVTTKKISKQTWNICAKIKEVDHFLRQNREFIPVVMEAHPELCFAGLNRGGVMKESKKTTAGREQRMEILSHSNVLSLRTVHGMLSYYDKSSMASDDIVDAACLCLTGILGLEEGLAVVNDPVGSDSHGIPMRMVYFNRQSHPPQV